MMPQSLRRGLLVRLGLLMLLFSALASVVVYRLAQRFSDEAYDEWLLDSARSMAQLVHLDDHGRMAAELPASILQAFTYDAHDRVLFRIDAQQGGLIGGSKALPKAGSSESDKVYVDMTVDGQAMRAVQVVRTDLEPGNPVFITVAETLHKRHRLASRLLGAVMLLSGLLGVVTVALARDAVTRGLKPLRDLTETVRLRSPGELHPLPDAGVAVELRAFTQAINDLLSQLHQAVQHQRRFVADAAHQLRTPLAALRVELELAVREPDVQRHGEALVQMRTGIERLSRLATQLLTLSRAEPGALAMSSFKVLDVQALVQEAAQRLLKSAIARNIDLGFECFAHPRVRGDALLLEELVSNLVDNALRYAGEGAVVTVRVFTQDNEACICVEDDGPGVTPQELPRLTERFHRATGASAGGSGLGLAIVQEIAHLHGGTLDIESVEPHGLRVTTRLPVYLPTTPE